MRRDAARRLAVGLAAALVLSAGACRNRNPTGALIPPKGAEAWDPKFRVTYDDAYTREPINLAGRAPHDVLDQQLFASRLGHANIVALVTVDQVWGRGRYQSDQNQYLDVSLEDVLMGELPKNANEQQLLRITGEEELPGTLQGKKMVLFLRWAPKQQPPYHHHLMPADDEVVAYIEALVEHAKAEGVLTDDGTRSKRKRRKRKKGRDKADAEVSTEDEVP
jgi:hypothetical protein